MAQYSLSGSFTYFSPRGSSVVNYAISSIDFMDYIQFFSVGNKLLQPIQIIVL